MEQKGLELEHWISFCELFKRVGEMDCVAVEIKYAGTKIKKFSDVSY